MNQEQIDRVIAWLSLPEKKGNAKAEMMLAYLNQDRQIGDKSAFIQKNLQPSILRTIIY
jgi:hypothetical protein